MTTIADAARQITGITGMDSDEALTLATTYAIQLDIETGTQEGGQAPNIEISIEDAQSIVYAATQSA